MEGAGVSTRATIATGDQEAIKILLQPKYVEDLSERELEFVESLKGRPAWTLKQEEWFNAIWQRVMA